MDNVNIVVVNYILHNALALDEAQMKNTVVKVDLSGVYVNKFKEMIHIIKAVSITIFTYLKKLVADAIILKYFSRDVYYECNYYYDSTKLFGDLFYEKNASSSYGNIETVSLGLTLVVA